MNWRLLGLLLLAVGAVAAWRASIDIRNTTLVIIEAFVALIAGGLGIRLMFPNPED